MLVLVGSSIVTTAGNSGSSITGATGTTGPTGSTAASNGAASAKEIGAAYIILSEGSDLTAFFNYAIPDQVSVCKTNLTPSGPPRVQQPGSRNGRRPGQPGHPQHHGKHLPGGSVPVPTPIPTWGRAGPGIRAGSRRELAGGTGR